MSSFAVFNKASEFNVNSASGMGNVPENLPLILKPKILIAIAKANFCTQYFAFEFNSAYVKKFNCASDGPDTKPLP